MTALLLRQPRTLCFFCQSLVSPQPQRPLAFLCPHCGCWNRYDANGDILSDDPAMHDESLNRKSFARRGVHSQLSVLVTSLSCCASASPRKDRLLTTFGSAPFCSTCQSNQRLIVSLLSSYLPPSDDVRSRSVLHCLLSLSSSCVGLQDPDYEPRLASFASYKASMHARYPPVCEKCAPLVEEEIRKKDVMARSNALGSWLNESKKKDTRRQVLSSSVDRYKLNRELRWWAARGVLWVVTLVAVISVDVAGEYDVRFYYAGVDLLSSMTRGLGLFDLTQNEPPRPFADSSGSPLNTLDCLATHLRVFSKSRTPGSEGTRTG